MKKLKKKVEKMSLSRKIALAMLLTPLLSSLIIFVLYYGYMRDFYREKVEIFQENNRETMTSNVKALMRQVDYVSSQVLGLAVLSDDFSGYSQKDSYERMLLNKEVNSRLINISISNEMIDNIYLVDFDGNTFTSNSDWDREIYLKEMNISLSREQEGRREIVPPHQALYRHIGGTSSAPYMISVMIYLNRYTESESIGLVQIDIAYEKMREAMEYVEMTEEDFAFVVDAEGNLIYAPEKENAGKQVSEVSYGVYQLGDLCQSVSQKDMPSFLKAESLGKMGWKLIQVNGDSMLREELQKIQTTWILIFLVCLLCAAGFSLSLSHSITKPVVTLIKSMGEISRGNFDIQVEQPQMPELSELVSGFNTMIQEVDMLMKENIQKEHDKTRMEMMALNAKINSHFLYNTLNTIKWQAIAEKQMGIAESIVALTKILEYSFRNTLDMVPLEDELRFIEDYIYIQSIRYACSVKMKYDIEDVCRHCLVPKMILQPIVENALLHAFDKQAGNNRILLSCISKNRIMRITVYDNGKGFDYQGFDKLTGIGLTNVRERLHLNFGENGRLEIKSEVGQGTTVIMEMPLMEAERDV